MEPDYARLQRESLERLAAMHRRDERIKARVDVYLRLMWAKVLEIAKRRPGATSIVVWLAIGALVALDQVAPVVTTPHTGAWIQFLITGIATALGWIGSQAVTLVVTIAQAAIMIATAVAQFAIQIGAVLLKVYGLLGDFWSHALKPFVSWAWTQVDRLSAWLQRTLGPVLRFLNEVRQQIDKFYNRWFKPVFDAIDATRRIFQILAQLHVPFARAIDRALAKLESLLLWPIQQLYYRLNEVMNWVNRIMTLDGYLQRLTLIRSLLRYQRDALAVWWQSVHRPLAGDKRAEYDRPLETRSVDEVHVEIASFLRTGDGPNGALIEEHAADIRTAMRSAWRL